MSDELKAPELTNEMVFKYLTHENVIIGYLEKKYLEDLINKITATSDIGLIKTHIINLLDAIRNEPRLREDLIRLLYDIEEEEIYDRKELKGRLVGKIKDMMN